MPLRSSGFGRRPNGAARNGSPSPAARQGIGAARSEPAKPAQTARSADKTSGRAERGADTSSILKAAPQSTQKTPQQTPARAVGASARQAPTRTALPGASAKASPGGRRNGAGGQAGSVAAAGQAKAAASPPRPVETSAPRPATREQTEKRAQITALLLDTIDLVSLAKLEPGEARSQIAEILPEMLEEQSVHMSSADRAQLAREIADQVLGYGPLQPLIDRDDIADIMVNGTENIFIEVDGKTQETDIRFDDAEQLLNICQRIVSAVGRRVDESSPICDARLPDGSRVNVIAPPLAIDGTSLTIRKFKKDKLTLDQLVGFGSITPDGAEILRIIGRVRCNVLISGGTGSGKTTLLNCLTAYIDPDERIVTCEDSAELQLQQPHVVRLETRPPNLEGEGEVTMRDLVKNCLRMRPERIIVGEVRGPEAFDLMQAMNTGHDGSMGTIHANSPREALSRIESMFSIGGFNLPSKTVREMLVSSIDVIVQATRLRDGRRVITHITEVVGMEEDVIITQDLFLYEITGEDAKGRLQGHHRATGIGKPNFWDRARYYNEHDRLAGALAAAEMDNISGDDFLDDDDDDYLGGGLR